MFKQAINNQSIFAKYEIFFIQTFRQYLMKWRSASGQAYNMSKLNASFLWSADIVSD